jgi:guanosine-3',5'-bis(diphosphate) 3'-pyrophosphohydrolase
MNIDKEKIIKNIIEAVPDKYEDIVHEAILYIDNLHKGQKRENGEDWVIHNLKVAQYCADMKTDTDTIISALFHDFSDFDTEEPTKEEIFVKEKFGENVFNIIYANRQINKATASEETDYNVITKYILKNSKDIRPLLIKLADVSHNSESLDILSEENKHTVIKKILNIYGPLAEYLNLNVLKKKIEENAFQAYKPEEYQYIEEELEKFGISQTLLKKYLIKLEEYTSSFEYKPQIEGRIKSKYSIYNKLKKYEKEKQKPSIKTLSDLIALRIITKTEDDCYHFLEKLMDHADLIYDEFNDYIMQPKPNGYRAIQGPLKFPEISDLEVEVQIMTHEMYYCNTYGPASHIAYKASRRRFAEVTDKYNWVENLHRAINEHINKRETERSLPITCNIFANETFVFTPHGKIIELEKGCTALDFAYTVHTQIGYSAVGAKVNGRAASLDTVLKTGDIVEIKTQNNKKYPNEDTLKYVKSKRARTKIYQGLTKARNEKLL